MSSWVIKLAAIVALAAISVLLILNEAEATQITLTIFAIAGLGGYELYKQIKNGGS